MPNLRTIADSFYNSFYQHEWIDSSDADLHELSITEAYEVQRLVAEQRIKAGEKVVGYKVGCTSAAIQSQFGLNEPICARLFEPHVQQEGVRLDWATYSNCAIEPEMVIRIDRDIVGDDLTDQALLNSIEYVSPGVELHNFKFWCGKPTLQELICSGGIHAGLVVGKNRVSPQVLNFKDEVFSVYINGKMAATSTASEILGGPLHSLRWLLQFLSNRGEKLMKGAYVIPGSPTELIEINHDLELKVSIGKVGEMIVPFCAKDKSLSK